MDQVLLDRLCNDFLADTLVAYIAELFDIDEAANRLLKRVLTSTIFMAPTGTGMSGKTDTAMEERKCNTTFVMKGQMNTAKA